MESFSKLLAVAAVGLVAMSSRMFAESFPGRTSNQLSLTRALEVTARVFFPDGHSVATWLTVDPAQPPANVIDGLLGTTESMCVFSNPGDIGRGWRVHVTRLDEGGTAVTAQVDWQRQAQDDSPKKSQLVALEVGNSIPLDYISASDADRIGTCNAVGMLLTISRTVGKTSK